MEQDEAVPLFKVFMPPSVLDPLRQVLLGGYVGEGPRVEQFERELSPWFGRTNVLALNNGTAALHLALRLCGVGPGDEVISTPLTSVATNEPIVAAGARIVWADIDPGTGNMDPADVERKITRRTRAILPVHWGGYPCDIDEIGRLAAGHGIRVIEDACHAFGATYRGSPIGSHSDFVCFSFQAIKTMTTVDGGALVSRSNEDNERGRRLRWYGIDRRSRPAASGPHGDVIEHGYKYHMNDVTAAIGLEQLKYVGRNLAKARFHAARYDEAFRPLKSVRALGYAKDREGSYWLYTLRVAERARFVEWMSRARVAVSEVHLRNDRLALFREFAADLPGVDEFAGEHVCIPVGWWLDEEARERVVRAVEGFDAATRG